MKPRRLRDIIWKSTTGSQVAVRVVVGGDRRRVGGPALDRRGARVGGGPAGGHSFGGGDEVVAAAEARAVAGQRDHVHAGVEVRALHAGSELTRHLERDPVAALGTIQRDPGDTAVALVGQGRQLVHW